MRKLDCLNYLGVVIFARHDNPDYLLPVRASARQFFPKCDADKDAEFTKRINKAVHSSG